MRIIKINYTKPGSLVKKIELSGATEIWKVFDFFTTLTQGETPWIPVRGPRGPSLNLLPTAFWRPPRPQKIGDLKTYWFGIVNFDNSHPSRQIWNFLFKFVDFDENYQN